MSHDSVRFQDCTMMQPPAPIRLSHLLCPYICSSACHLPILLSFLAFSRPRPWSMICTEKKGNGNSVKVEEKNNTHTKGNKGIKKKRGIKTVEIRTRANP